MTSSAHSELIQITEEQSSVIIDMAYATANNFTGTPVYPSQDCYLHPAAAGAPENETENLGCLQVKGRPSRVIQNDARP